MDLSERKKQILRAIVDGYIRTAEPVGSSYVLQNNDLGISSATIRNEMAYLEETGYLDKPHTSAGRVPSSMGYRFYVDELMQKYQFTVNEIDRMEDALSKRYSELSNIIKDISNTVSYLTNYTALVSTPITLSSRISCIKFVPIDKHSMVMIIIASDGGVRNTVITAPYELNPDVLGRLEEYLNNIFSNMQFEDVNEEFLRVQRDNIPMEDALINDIFSFISSVSEAQNSFDVINSGLANMLNYPEFSNVEKTKKFFGFIKDIDRDFFAKRVSGDRDTIEVVIGDEEPILKELGLSMVISNYDLGNGQRGGIAIIGPTRMDYSKVVATLDYMKKNTTKYLGTGKGDDTNGRK